MLSLGRFEFAQNLGSTTVHYNGLLVGILDCDIVTLLTQGKYTATTARILNTLALVWNVPVSFYRQNGQFVMSYTGKVFTFKNRVFLNRHTGEIFTID